ncbi:MAG: hypothetical protein GX986_07985 [Firmicutes bacterium]|nr:hypothetical protein [Bacillota bacterium]
MPNRAAYGRKATTRRLFWQMVFSGRFTYSEVAAMDWDEFWEAHGALVNYDKIMPKPKKPKR